MIRVVSCLPYHSEACRCHRNAVAQAFRKPLAGPLRDCLEGLLIGTTICAGAVLLAYVLCVIQNAWLG